MKKTPQPHRPPGRFSDLARDIETTPGEVKRAAAVLGITEPLSPANAARITSALAAEEEARAARLSALPKPRTLAAIVKNAAARWLPQGRRLRQGAAAPGNRLPVEAKP